MRPNVPAVTMRVSFDEWLEREIANAQAMKMVPRETAPPYTRPSDAECNGMIIAYGRVLHWLRGRR